MKEELNNKTLSEAGEKQVSGGYKGDWRTVMKCNHCGNETEWLGDYRKMGPFKCSCCKTESLYGTDIYYQD